MDHADQAAPAALLHNLVRVQQHLVSVGLVAADAALINPDTGAADRLQGQSRIVDVLVLHEAQDGAHRAQHAPAQTHLDLGVPVGAGRNHHFPAQDRGVAIQRERE